MVELEGPTGVFEGLVVAAAVVTVAGPVDMEMTGTVTVQELQVTGMVVLPVVMVVGDGQKVVVVPETLNQQGSVPSTMNNNSPTVTG